MKTLIMTILILTHGSVAADDDIKIKIPQSKCSDTDIRTQNPSLKKHFSRPRSQDSIGWCYGFAAADLLSVELGNPVSATHASAIYNNDVRSNFFWKTAYGVAKIVAPGDLDKTYEGGFSKKAIKAMIKKGKVCSEVDFPFDGDYWQEILPMIQSLENIQTKIKESSNIEQTCNAIENVKTLNPLLTVEINEIYSILHNSNINTALSQLIDKHCENKFLSVAKDIKVKSKGRPQLRRGADERDVRRLTRRVRNYLGTVNSSLEAGKPLSIEYNIKHITKGSGPHVSVLTGRRWKDGVCQFKVRNSWGTGCSAYSVDKISECNSEEGSYWITDQKFYEMVSRVTYITNE